MKSIFSREGRSALDEYTRARTLYAFDFDGTIAPLVHQPDGAFTFEELRPLLRRHTVKSKTAIISGRAVKDLGRRLHFRPHFVVGNHGLEGISEFKEKGERAKKVCRVWIEQLERDLSSLPAKHEIFVEDKRQSISLLYGHAQNRIRARKWLTNGIANLRPKPPRYQW